MYFFGCKILGSVGPLRHVYTRVPPWGPSWAADFQSSFIETQAFVENKVHFKSGAIFAANRAMSLECCYNSRSNLGMSTQMCPAGEIHGKPLAHNRPHTPSQLSVVLYQPAMLCCAYNENLEIQKVS